MAQSGQNALEPAHEVWTIVSLVFYPPEFRTGYFWVVGFLMTGLALLVIGLLLGQIGRAARTAELPLTEVTPTAVQSEQDASVLMPLVVPVSPAVQGRTAPIPALNGLALANPTPAMRSEGGIIQPTSN